MWTQPIIFTFSIHVGSSDVFTVQNLHKEQQKIAYFLPVTLMENSTATVVQQKIL